MDHDAVVLRVPYPVERPILGICKMDFEAEILQRIADDLRCGRIRADNGSPVTQFEEVLVEFRFAHNLFPYLNIQFQAAGVDRLAFQFLDSDQFRGT